MRFRLPPESLNICPVGLAVRIWEFHSQEAGSTPVPDTVAIAQLVEQWIVVPQVEGFKSP